MQCEKLVSQRSVFVHIHSALCISQTLLMVITSLINLRRKMEVSIPREWCKVAIVALASVQKHLERGKDTCHREQHGTSGVGGTRSRCSRDSDGGTVAGRGGRWGWGIDGGSADRLGDRGADGGGVGLERGDDGGVAIGDVDGRVNRLYAWGRHFCHLGHINLHGGSDWNRLGNNVLLGRGDGLGASLGDVNGVARQDGGVGGLGADLGDEDFGGLVLRHGVRIIGCGGDGNNRLDCRGRGPDNDLGGTLNGLGLSHRAERRQGRVDLSRGRFGHFRTGNGSIDDSFGVGDGNASRD